MYAAAIWIIVTIVTIDACLAILRGNGWFARLAPSLQERLVAAGRATELARGQWVYGQGDERTGLCAILEGALRIEVALDADRDVLIGMAAAPVVFGQSRRRGGGPRIVTLRAGVPSRVLMIPDEALERVADAEPGVWRAVNELVYAQLEESTRLAARLLDQRPEARIAMRLLQSPDPQLAIAQADLAEMTGLSRKTVNAHLAAFQHAGWITRGYRTITIADRASLERLVRG